MHYKIEQKKLKIAHSIDKKYKNDIFDQYNIEVV